VRSLQSGCDFAVFILNSVKFACRQYRSSGNFRKISPYVLNSIWNRGEAKSC